MRDHAGLDQWDHFDWIVNQTGSNVTYQVGSQSYILNIGCFDLWKNGNLLIQNSDEKTTSPQDTVIDGVAIGFIFELDDLFFENLFGERVRRRKSSRRC